MRLYLSMLYHRIVLLSSSFYLAELSTLVRLFKLGFIESSYKHTFARRAVTRKGVALACVFTAPLVYAIDR